MYPSNQSVILVALIAAALIFSALFCFAKAVRVRRGLYSPFRESDGTMVQGIEHIRPKLSSIYAFQGGALLLGSALFLGNRNPLFGVVAFVAIYAAGTIARQYLARPVLRAR